MRRGRSSRSPAADSLPGSLLSRLQPGSSGERHLVWTLGLGAFGLAFSLTTTAAVLPLRLHHFTGSAGLIGLILGAEGAFALTVPLVIGPWSDSFHTPMGRRKPFMLAAVGPIVFCLALVAFMPNLWTTTALVLAFFFAYYVYEPPYRGLYPDLLPVSVYGRAQGVQHLLRGVALGTGFLGALGLYYEVWRAGPFVLAAAVVGAACLAPILLVTEDGGDERVFEGVGTYLRHSWRVFSANPNVRRFLIANAAWEGTFAGARTFVMLYITIGLGATKTAGFAALGTVTLGYVVAAICSGRIGDRLGLARVIWLCSFVYGLGLLAAGVAQRWHYWYLGLVFFVSVAAGSVMTLAWGLLFKLMPPRDRGAIVGLATTTKGLGLFVGVPLTGLAIDLLKPHLDTTQGYQALWPILGVPILAAIPLVKALERVESEADRVSARQQREAPDALVDDVDDGLRAPVA